jgi:superfamily II DNA or RNA helicase
MAYFRKKNVCMKLLANKNNELRQCQHGGLLAVLAHFTASYEPAIVSLPTGAGKTELIFAIAFALRAKRILIVEPSSFLRTQTTQRLKDLKLFREQKLLRASAPQPKVYEAKSIMQTPQNWEHLLNYDAVVATPKTVSPEERLVCTPPENLFDIVFIDEAHHAAAKTWRAIVREFKNAQTILLTATAFRRDRRRLPGRLVYHYPIGRALRDNIYRPVEFLPVKYNGNQDADDRIAQATVKKFKEELRSNPDAALMIRTDRIAKCENLCKLYSNLGVTAVEIHSELSSTTARERLEQLRSGTINAVVTVGMMAEGIDVPGLKVAALHAPPRTLPYTLQLVGRVSRVLATQTGSAWLVATPEQVKGEAIRLFREDRDWKEFIPSLVEEAIKEAHGDRADVILQDSTSSSLLPELLTPFFSIVVRKFSEGNGKIHDERFPLGIDSTKGMPKEVESIEVLGEVDEDCVLVITSSASAPKWGQDSGLYDTRHDLHMLYAPPKTRMLFTATTSPVIMKALIETLVDKTVELDPKCMQGVLSNATANNYTVVGLENALGLTGNHPSYKIHIGPGSASSVRPSDGAIYGPGHAMGRMLDGELRGTAIRNQRVWAMKREPMRDFTAWCRDIANQLQSPGPGLPGLQFLAQPVPATELFNDETRPIGIVASDRHFCLPLNSLVQVGEETLDANQYPVIKVIDMNNGVLTAELAFREDLEGINLSYQAESRYKHWVLKDSRQFEIKDPLSGERYRLEDFLNDHPPIILMPNGGAIRGHYGWKIIKDLPELPTEIFNKIDWSDTDITKEARPTTNGQKNVQKKTLEELQSNLPSDAIIIIDDGANEIADIIVIEPNKHLVQFVHCKFSSETDTGNRVKDWYELFDQTTRSHAWIRRHNLLYELDQRIDRRQNTKIIPNMGSRQDLQNLSSDYKANEWNFQVYAVQPGSDIEKVLKEENSHVYRGLAVAREWLLQAGAELVVWGS